MKMIKLTKGAVAIVDDDVFEWASKFRWYYCKQYAMRTVKTKKGKHTVLLHREIMKTPEGMDTDHINGNKIDCRRENLRVCTHQENSRNQKIRKNNTSGFKGVYFNKKAKKYQSYIHINYKAIYLGLFSTALEASKAYELAAINHFGEFRRKEIFVYGD
jgi:hypothetical protein